MARYNSLSGFPFIKDLEKCLQCGKCVGVCPAARVSSFNSRKLIRDINIGNIEKVLASKELWTCFFCAACYANCPRDINFPLAVIILRTASLRAGYGFEHVKKLLLYGWNYYHHGITISDEEVNATVGEAVAKNSGTDGTIRAIRKKMGMPEKRIVSQRALAEIQYIADTTEMTATLQELPEREGKPLQWRYGGRKNFSWENFAAGTHHVHHAKALVHAKTLVPKLPFGNTMPLETEFLPQGVPKQEFGNEEGIGVWERGGGI